MKARQRAALTSLILRQLRLMAEQEQKIFKEDGTYLSLLFCDDEDLYRIAKLMGNV